jgi:hypothetical protein
LGYVVRQANVRDWPRIAAFIDRTYGSSAPFKGRARWDWQFRQTPYDREKRGLAPVWIAVDADDVVGQLALQPGLLWLDGAALQVGWIVDVMVDPAHRGRGLSHKINDAIVLSGRTLVTLTMAAATRSIMERAGCVTLPPVRQMVRVDHLSGQTVSVLLSRAKENRANWGRLIDLFIATRVGPALVAFALTVAARLVPGRLFGPRPTPALQDSGLPDPAAVDRLAAALVAKTGAMFDRSARFFAWRFGAAPDLEYRFAQGPDGARPEAIVVWRMPTAVELPVGTLVDVLADPDDSAAMGAGIDHALAAMSGRCEAVIAGASDPRFIWELRRRGFVTVKTHHPTVVSSDRDLLASLVAHKGSWHFSKADHDWDQVHPAAD